MRGFANMLEVSESDTVHVNDISCYVLKRLTRNRFLVQEEYDSPVRKFYLVVEQQSNNTFKVLHKMPI